MKIATGCSVAPIAKDSVHEAFGLLMAGQSVLPQLLLLSCTGTYDQEEVLATLRALAPGVTIHGGTSCLGVMSQTGYHAEQGFGLGLLGVFDPDGAYGTGAARLEDDATKAGAAALSLALQAADRPGEVPNLVWMTSAPGQEEGVIEGIEQALGNQVPILGGSSADNTVSGGWSQHTHHQVYRDAVVLTVLFPSTEPVFAFHSGYEPTSRSGRVTAATGRTLLEIDGLPAAQVYNTWSDGRFAEWLGGGTILGPSTLNPLGRVVGHIGGIPYFQLSHPAAVTSEGGLELFSEVHPGDELWLMEGTLESLASRAGRVASAALATHDHGPGEVAGAAVIFCAGCMLAIQERMEEVGRGLSQALGGAPFLGSFTFGEQGCFPGGENRHGNLMITVLIFVK